jgi:hypothetical protein
VQVLVPRVHPAVVVGAPPFPPSVFSSPHSAPTTSRQPTRERIFSRLRDEMSAGGVFELLEVHTDVAIGVQVGVWATPLGASIAILRLNNLWSTAPTRAFGFVPSWSSTFPEWTHGGGGPRRQTQHISPKQLPMPHTFQMGSLESAAWGLSVVSSDRALQTTNLNVPRLEPSNLSDAMKGVIDWQHNTRSEAKATPACQSSDFKLENHSVFHHLNAGSFFFTPPRTPPHAHFAQCRRPISDPCLGPLPPLWQYQSAFYPILTRTSARTVTAT